MTGNRAIERLRALPLSERRTALEELVVTEFKATLLMTDDEELPLDGSYFDLGFTSLRITEIKDRLEDVLACGISANVLFNQPTVTQLLEHLTRDVLVDLFDSGDGIRADDAAAARRAIADSIFEDLYQS
jgi:acyl carrier protein